MGVPINNVPRRVVFAADGVGPYAFTFEILAAGDIAVFRDDLLLTLTTDYTVTINPDGTGSVTLVAEPTGATQIAIVGNRTIQRISDFVTGGDFFANTLNDELDQQTIFNQQNAEAVDRALKAPQTDPLNIDMTLPRASVRANKTLAFDTDGNPTTGEVIGDNRGDWAAGTSYNKRDIVKDTSNGNVYYANTAHTSTGVLPIDTNADAAKWDLLVDNASAGASATAAAASATAAAGSATAASTSATNAATSATNAANSATAAGTSATNAASSATAAAGSATTASTAATNAGNSATAAATSATNASNSATAAATSEGNAANSATAASTSASNAATSATNAANSASTATTQASNAATSATNAAASATAADGSATAAAGSATAAASSATAAAASFDSFDDRYLGAKSTAPTVDNDGDPLIVGALYFDTTLNEMRVYDGSLWKSAGSTVNGTAVRQTFTATAAQTTFTITGGYDAGFADVYLNGVKLVNGVDVNVTSGTNVVLTVGAAAGDSVDVIAYGAFVLANHYTIAQADAEFLPQVNPSYTGTLTGGTGVINIGSGQLYKDASGNVGIGTSSPGARLDLRGTSNPSVKVWSQAGTSGNYAELALHSYNDFSGFGQTYIRGLSTASGNSGTALTFATEDNGFGGPVERMRIDSAGNVGIGTSSPAHQLDISGISGTLRVTQTLDVLGAGLNLFGASNQGNLGRINIWQETAGAKGGFIRFDTCPTGTNTFTERARINSSGFLKASNTGAYDGGTKTYEFTSNENDLTALVGNNNASFSSVGLGVYIARNTTNNSFYPIVYRNTGAGADRFRVADTGNVTNTNNSYGSISDAKLKENVTDATPKLDKLNQVRIVNYNLIGEEQKQLGVIAQELEQIFPGMVDESPDRDAEGNDLGTTTKSVKYSVFVPMLIKAMQEQQALITSQTAALQEAVAEINSLKARVEALEGAAE
jgi:hypothetical protein